MCELDSLEMILINSNVFFLLMTLNPIETCAEASDKSSLFTC